MDCLLSWGIHSSGEMEDSLTQIYHMSAHGKCHGFEKQSQGKQLSEKSGQGRAL